MKLKLLIAFTLFSLLASAQIETIWPFYQPEMYYATSLDLVVKDDNHYLIFRENDTQPAAYITFKGFNSAGVEFINKKYQVPGLLLNNTGPDNTVNDGNYIYLIIPANFRYTADSTNYQQTTLIKFNYQGDTMWTRPIGPNTFQYNSFINGIHKTDDGVLLLTGFRRPSNPQSSGDTLQCLTLTRVDLDGNILSHKEIPSPVLNHVFVYNTVYYDNKLYYSISKHRQFNPQSSNYIDLNESSYIMVLDTGGAIVNQSLIYAATDTMSYADNITYMGAKALDNGTILVAGWQNLGPSNAYITLKNINPDLSVNWNKFLYYMPNDAYVTDILSCGSTIKIFGSTGDIQAYDDRWGFILDLDLNGDSIAYVDTTILPHGYEQGFFDAEVNLSGKVIASYFTYKIDDDLPASSNYAIIKADGFGCSYVPLAVNEKADDKTGLLHFYPNPANNTVTIANRANEPISYSLINQYGSKVLEFNAAANTTYNCSVSQYAQGIYYLYAITQSGKVAAGRLVIN